MENRTIQRRIAKLKKQGRLIVTGKARAVRYHLPIENELPIHSELATQHETQTDLIPLTLASKRLISELAKPIQARKPVGYDNIGPIRF